MLGFPEVEFIGHEVDDEDIKPRSQKVDEILRVDRPRTKRQIQAFVALVGYYGKFIPHFADIAAPLTELTKKNHPNVVKWGKDEEEAFQKLKCTLAEAPVLKILDCSKIMYVQTDASDLGVGCCLMQEYDGVLHPVRYASRKLKGAERHYSTIEKECLAIVWAVDKLRVFLYGREFVLLTDHKPLTYINETRSKNGRVMRWSMFLQDWTFRIESIKGVDNLAADYLSRA